MTDISAQSVQTGNDSDAQQSENEQTESVQVPEPVAENNPLRTATIPTDFSVYPHNLYAVPNQNGEVETVTMQVGLMELTVPETVKLPAKFNPKLTPVEKYVRPSERE